jgi:hypothetical protein
VGGGDGDIYCVDLCSPIATASGSPSFAVPQRLKGHEGMQALYTRSVCLYSRSLLTLVHTSGAILSLAFSLEGCYLISGSRDRTAKVWGSVSGQKETYYI